MLACRALVAMLVVAGDASHQLLGLGTVLVLRFLLEVFCVIASQRRCQATPMEYLDITVLPYPEGEPEIVGFRWALHLAVLRATLIKPALSG